jgi:hypothetical protein
VSAEPAAELQVSTLALAATPMTLLSAASWPRDEISERGAAVATFEPMPPQSDNMVVAAPMGGRTGLGGLPASSAPYPADGVATAGRGSVSEVEEERRPIAGDQETQEKAVHDAFNAPEGDAP